MDSILIAETDEKFELVGFYKGDKLNAICVYDEALLVFHESGVFSTYFESNKELKKLLTSLPQSMGLKKIHDIMVESKWEGENNEKVVIYLVRNRIQSAYSKDDDKTMITFDDNTTIDVETSINSIFDQM